MENLTPETLLALQKVGICLLVNGLIQLNRDMVRPKLINTKYENISLYAEHFLSYWTYCLGLEGVAKLFNLDLNILLTLPLFRAITGDLMMDKEEQWDQFAFDIAGIGAYLLTK